MKWSELKRLDRSVWFLIWGTMLSKAAYFISMPYLALRLKSALGLDPFTVGLVLGVGPFVGILGGFYLGHLSDQYGRRSVFAGSILLGSLTFAGYGVGSALWHFVGLSVLNGLSNSTNQTISAALISDLTEPALRKPAFHLRYFAINLGASFGPFIGAWLLLWNPSLGFFLTAGVYFAFGIACLLRLPVRPDAAVGSVEKKATFTETLRALGGDRVLLIYTLALIVVGTAYAQLDSTLPQFLQALRGAGGVKLYGTLMGINALTVVLFQLPLTRLTSRFTLIGTVRLGCLVFGVGLALWGILPFSAGGYMAAMVILTLGEVLIFSNGNLVIDQIAPEDKKGAYFGASGLWAVGAALGPSLGGYVLMEVGGRGLFTVMGLLASLNQSLYWLGARLQKGARKR